MSGRRRRREYDGWGFFHLTDAKNLDRILADGLRAGDDGYIYLFTDLLVANTIARDQVFIADRYAVLVVSATGITRRIWRDRVGELAAPYQRRTKQEIIKPKFLQHAGTFDVVRGYPTEWDYLVEEQLSGLSREQADARYAWRRGEMSDEAVTRFTGLRHSTRPSG